MWGQYCGMQNGINGEFSLGTKHTEKIGQVQKTLHSWWRRKVAKPISNVDSFVKHVYRAHSQETDHWANIGVQERRKIIIDRRNDSATWKAIRGFWDGSFKDNGRSGCGVVIKGVGRERWVTSSKIAIPLIVGAAMAAEIAGVCVLTSILDSDLLQMLECSKRQSAYQ